MIPPREMPADYLAELETTARRYGAGTWTGSTGKLAAGLFHALQHAAALAHQLDNPTPEAAPMDNANPNDPELSAAWERHRQRQARYQAKACTTPPAADSGRPPSETLLLEAAATVADRRKTYGSCTDHFRITVGLLNAAFAAKLRERLAAGLEPFELTDWPLIMSLDKVARYLGPGRSKDCATDLAGYAGTLRECEGHNGH